MAGKLRVFHGAPLERLGEILRGKALLAPTLAGFGTGDDLVRFFSELRPGELDRFTRSRGDPEVVREIYLERHGNPLPAVSRTPSRAERLDRNDARWDKAYRWARGVGHPRILESERLRASQARPGTFEPKTNAARGDEFREVQRNFHVFLSNTQAVANVYGKKQAEGAPAAPSVVLELEVPRGLVRSRSKSTFVLAPLLLGIHHLKAIHAPAGHAGMVRRMLAQHPELGNVRVVERR